MKRFLTVILIIALAVPVFATMGSDEIATARQIISSNASCGKLNESQLELIGDYYMELMHPGQAHDAMEDMLGGEGSASLKQAHLQMAQVLYCGETNTSVTYGGMMGMMPLMGRFGGYGGGMMGYGMMNYGNMMGYGDWWWVFGLLFWALVFVALALAVYWLYRNVRSGGTALSASDILKQRYAKGEISKKEYQEMKKDLEG